MYQRRVDRTSPACFVFLVDQSFSMNEPCAGKPGHSKAQALAQAMNNLLYELVIRCVKSPAEGPRHYYDIAVIGYGSDVGPAWVGDLAGTDMWSIVDIAEHPVRIEEVDASTTGGGKRPIWLEPSGNGATPMSSAMDRAGQLVGPWVQAHPDSFPPIVINISDGASTDGDPSVWTQRLSTLATTDGNVLVFNLNLSAVGGEQIFFPSDAGRLPDDYSRQMFEMSSELPGFMQEMAGMQGHVIQPGARGFVFNADITSVVNFLQIGTATHHAAP